MPPGTTPGAAGVAGVVVPRSPATVPTATSVCAVAQLGIVTRRAAMGQVAQDRETLLDDVVALATFDVCYKTDPASILFVCRIV